MKKLILLLVMLLSLPMAYAGNINKIVFFGDSLTDNGNLYNYLLHIIPKSPPYYEGRFTNGPTWAESVATYYQEKNAITSTNYAVAGSTTIFHIPKSKFISPSTLTIQLDSYFLDTIFRDKSHTLFVIWMGGNDYIFDPDYEPIEATDKVVDKLSLSIQKLYDHGARHFLILNLPDLSRVPEVIENGDADKLNVMTVLHNQKLAVELARLRTEFRDIDIAELEIYATFDSAMSNPDEFNRIHHTHLSNMTEACWKGNFWLSKTLSQAALKNDIELAIAKQHDGQTTDYNADAMVSMVMNTPELAQTYQLGQSFLSGNVPCANPDDYLFWDHIHPTAVLHRVISDIVIEKISSSIL